MLTRRLELFVLLPTSVPAHIEQISVDMFPATITLFRTHHCLQLLDVGSWSLVAVKYWMLFHLASTFGFQFVSSPKKYRNGQPIRQGRQLKQKEPYSSILLQLQLLLQSYSCNSVTETQRTQAIESASTSHAPPCRPTWWPPRPHLLVNLLLHVLLGTAAHGIG